MKDYERIKDRSSLATAEAECLPDQPRLAQKEGIRQMSSAPLPCPFCGWPPAVLPLRPKKEGNAWGAVECVNDDCPAKPRVEDGEDVADERGSDAYKAAAVTRWNRRWISK